MGYQLACTLKGDMKIDTCSFFSWKYSFSSVGSITTTRPYHAVVTYDDIAVDKDERTYLYVLAYLGLRMNTG